MYLPELVESLFKEIIFYECNGKHLLELNSEVFKLSMISRLTAG